MSSFWVYDLCNGEILLGASRLNRSMPSISVYLPNSRFPYSKFTLIAYDKKSGIAYYEKI